MASINALECESTQVINFWFREIEPSYWFAKNTAFDNEIKNRFLAVFQAATKGELLSWRVNPEGRLAEIIVLD